MTNRTDYWVEIFKDGDRLGAGFFLTTCYVVTAFHCLEGVADDVVDVSFQDEIWSGRLHRQSPEADLALIDLSKRGSNSVAIPQADRPVVGDGWHSPYRPSAGHAYLTGNVSAASFDYRCEGGGTIEAMQLKCSQNIGDYSGYSGGPVERSGSEAKQTVLGILIEQYPDQGPAGMTSKRSSPVLFATTIAEILRRFDCFAVSHLIHLLQSSAAQRSTADPVAGTWSQEAPVSPGSRMGDDAISSRAPLDERIRAADAKVRALHEWQLNGLLDELEISRLKLQVAKGLVSDANGGDS